jgi:hypothetical protein
MIVSLNGLEVDETGRAVNHDEAEDRVRQFIGWKTHPDELPEAPFDKEELGIGPCLRCPDWE